MSIIENMEAFLEHSGVKGMKWGVRKDASKEDKKWAKNIYSAPGAVAVHNRAAEMLNGPHGIATINANPKYAGKNLLTNPKLQDAYNRDVMKMVGLTTKLAVDQIHGTSPSGNYKADLIVDARGTPVKVVVDSVDIKHATDVVKLEFDLETKNGMVEKFLMVDPESDFIAQGDLIVMDSHLEHYGVKGMKWGVRKDGSVSSTTQKMSSLRLKSTDVVVRQKPGRFVKTAGGRKQTASDDAVRVAAARQLAKRSTTDSLSTKQLQEAVNRMNLEIQYAKVVKKADRRDRGKRIVDSILGNPSTKQIVVKGATSAVRKAATGGVA